MFTTFKRNKKKWPFIYTSSNTEQKSDLKEKCLEKSYCWDAYSVGHAVYTYLTGLTYLFI